MTINLIIRLMAGLGLAHFTAEIGAETWDPGLILAFSSYSIMEQVGLS